MRCRWATTWVSHHHKARQVLIGRTEAVIEPRAETGLADEDAAGVHLQAAGGMRRRVRVHGADHAEVIRVHGGVWKEAADLKAALTVLLKLKGRLHQMAHGAAVGAYLGIAMVRHAMILFERRLRIKGIHLAWSAIHEEKHTVLRLQWKMRALFRQRRFRHQIGECQPGKTASGTHEVFASVHRFTQDRQTRSDSESPGRPAPVAALGETHASSSAHRARVRD